MRFGENETGVGELLKGCAVSLPGRRKSFGRSLQSRRRQSTATLQPDFPKGRRAAKRCGSESGTHRRTAVETQKDAQLPSMSCGLLIALGGCQPEAGDTTSQTTLFLPHPIFLPQSKHGGLRRYISLAQSWWELLEDRAQNHRLASKPLREESTCLGLNSQHYTELLTPTLNSHLGSHSTH